MVNVSELMSHIKDIARRVNAIEIEARNAIHLKGDEELYRQKMLDKANLIMRIQELVQPVMNNVSNERQKKILQELMEMAEDAAEAKEIGSIFYMSALLYPVHHKQGEPNELEVLLASVENENLFPC